MAIGIYASLYLLSKFKDRIPYAPRVDFVRFEDGLLVVRCARALTSKDTLVKLRATFGAIVAQVEVESYDNRDGVYRLSVLDHELLMAQMTPERREATRLPRALKLRSSQFHSEPLTTEDISETGARLLVPELLEPGTVLALGLELGDLKLQLEAEVAWSAVKMDGSFHSGVRFLNLTLAQLYNIRCYVEDHLKREQELKTLGDGRKKL